MGNHMHGMFAFALWDDEEKKLFCLRDQFGTTPFYYYETADGKLLYGTSIRKIMEQPGFVKKLNEEMLQLYLTFTYVAGETTFFRGLKKLMPGRFLTWQRRQLKIERYWKPEFHPDYSKSLEEWAEEIHTTLGRIMTEVKPRMRRQNPFYQEALILLMYWQCLMQRRRMPAGTKKNGLMNQNWHRRRAISLDERRSAA